MGKHERSQQKTRGIIRYAAGSGSAPEDHCAAFDAWYSDRNDALAVYHDWCQRYPHWIVGLVKSDETRFSNSDWTSIGHRGSICPLKRDASIGRDPRNIRPPSSR